MKTTKWFILIIMLFCNACINKHPEYERYLTKDHRSLLKELIRENKEQRKNGELSAFPYRIISEDPGSEKRISSSDGSFHAYDLYENGNLMTDMEYYKTGFLKTPVLRSVTEYYESGNMKERTVYTLSEAETTEYHDHKGYISLTDEMVEILDRYRPMMGFFTIASFIPEKEQAVKKRTKYTELGRTEEEYDEDGILTGFELETTNAMDRIFSEETEDGTTVKQYGYEIRSANGGTEKRVSELTYLEGRLLLRKDHLYQTWEGYPPHMIRNRSYFYSDRGELEGFKYANGEADQENTEYVHLFRRDDSGRLLHTEENNYSGSGSIDFIYNEDGDLTRIEGYWGSDFAFDLEYDDHRRLTRLASDSDSEYLFEYDDPGRRLSRTFIINGIPYQRIVYIYEP